VAADHDGAPRNSAERFAILESRSKGIEEAQNKLERDVTALRTSTDQGFKQIEDSVNTLSSNVQGKLAEQGKPQWQIIIGGGVAVITIVGGLGTLYLAPIQTRLESISRDQTRDANLFTDTVQQIRRDFRIELKTVDADKIDRKEIDIHTRYRDRDFDEIKKRIDRIEREHWQAPKPGARE
jgi:putative NADH-flavin reductase